jgi:ribosome-associated protein
VVVLKVGELTSITDYFLICSGESERQVKAISESIEAILLRQEEAPFSVEGLTYLNWVLMDYSNLVVHIFKQEARAFYNLERLWGDASRLSLPKSPQRESKLKSERSGRSSQR